MNPKVSFITGVKNRSQELKEMLQSLIDQDMPDWEAIIVDDHSEEPIEDVVKSFNDSRISFFTLLEDQTGICHARNLAISHAQSEIMLTADGDDISLSQRARRTYEIMTENNSDVFYCNLEFFMSEENKRWTTTFQPFNVELFKMFNFMTNPGTAFKKARCLNVGGFDPAFSLSEDYDLWLRILKTGGKFCFTEEILVNYRRSPQSVTVKRNDQLHNYIQKARIKNNLPPVDIDEVRILAEPKVADDILSEENRLIWQDDRFVRVMN